MKTVTLIATALVLTFLGLTQDSTQQLPIENNKESSAQNKKTGTDTTAAKKHVLRQFTSAIENAEGFLGKSEAEVLVVAINYSRAQGLVTETEITKYLTEKYKGQNWVMSTDGHTKILFHLSKKEDYYLLVFGAQQIKK